VASQSNISAATSTTSVETLTAGAASSEEAADDNDRHFAELSPGQAREFINGCSPKTKTALEVMANIVTAVFDENSNYIDQQGELRE